MPLTKVTTAMTAATPMTTPSRVSTERSLFAQRDSKAMWMASTILTDSESPFAKHHPTYPPQSWSKPPYDRANATIQDGFDGAKDTARALHPVAEQQNQPFQPSFKVDFQRSLESLEGCIVRGWWEPERKFRSIA